MYLVISLLTLTSCNDKANKTVVASKDQNNELFSFEFRGEASAKEICTEGFNFFKKVSTNNEKSVVTKFTGKCALHTTEQGEISSTTDCIVLTVKNIQLKSLPMIKPNTFSKCREISYDGNLSLEFKSNTSFLFKENSVSLQKIINKLYEIKTNNM
jgi:hypothetical protein